MAVTKFGNDGLVLSAAGEISGDKNGLWTGACVFKLPVGRYDLVPGVGVEHPLADFLMSERFRLTFSPGLWTVSVDYAGMSASYEDASPAQYDLSPGTGNEPIETHPKFVTDIGGKPSDPKNGARFRHYETGAETEDDALGVFDEFKLIVDGLKNPYAKGEAFIAQNNTVWTKSWTQRTKPDSYGVKIATPDGPYPDYGGDTNWLAMPIAYTQRGSVFTCTAKWIASGPGGWNATVYASA